MGVVYCEWGLQGVERFRDRVPVLVIVDVLSFSTAVDIAVSRGVSISPFPPGDVRAIRAAAKRLGVPATSTKRASEGQSYLSPTNLEAMRPGDRVLLPSPNGSRLCLPVGGVELLTACLRNVKAVAAKARALAGDADLAVIAAGELWPDNSLRPAIEDLIGAGAVIEALGMSVSAEAEIARAAFQAVRLRLGEFVRASVSGQDLLNRGFAHDLELAADLDVSGAAPLMRDGAFVDGWAEPRVRQA